jgi:hypothetical protein
MFTRNPTITDASPNPDPGPTLQELEDRIATGLGTVERVGLALMEIKSRRLYKDRYATFEAYLTDRWKMSLAYAQKLVEAASVCQELRSAGLPAPTRESHTRELRKVPTDKRSEAWTETLTAAGGNPEAVTAELVAAVATKHRTKKARRKAPRTIVLKGKGWTLSLTRKSIDVNPVQALTEALSKLTAASTPEVKAA